MKERRKFRRIVIPRKAKFFGSNGWEDCIIKEASRNGMRVNFFTTEKINEGSLIHLKVVLPSEPNPVEVKGMLKWIKQQDKHFVGGVEWFHIGKGVK